jgi:hypothetical protein
MTDYYNSGLRGSAPNSYQVGFLDVSADQVNKETNELFWKQTGYKVGKKLNPKDPADKPWVKVWVTFYNQVRASHERTGPLTAEQAKAEAHAQAAQASLKKATEAKKAGDPVAAAAHATEADVHAAIAAPVLIPQEFVIPETPEVTSPGFAPVVSRPSPTLPNKKGEYAAIAEQAASETPGNFVLVTVEDNGFVRTFNRFDGAAQLEQIYGTFSRDKYALVAWFNKTPGVAAVPSGLMDFVFNAPRVVTVTTQAPKESMLLPMLGLGLAGLVGVVVTKKKGHK